jgi:hypothetical protein
MRMQERNRRNRKERAEENSAGELILVCVLPATRYGKKGFGKQSLGSG